MYKDMADTTSNMSMTLNVEALTSVCDLKLLRQVAY